jgi:hypothetical protein
LPGGGMVLLHEHRRHEHQGPQGQTPRTCCVDGPRTKTPRTRKFFTDPKQTWPLTVSMLVALGPWAGWGRGPSIWGE